MKLSNLSSLFKSKQDIKISCPHGEKTPPQPQPTPTPTPTREAKSRSGAFEPNGHDFAYKRVTAPKREYRINPADRIPLCPLSEFTLAPLQLARMVELRSKCAPEHVVTIDRAVDRMFMMTVASVSIPVLKVTLADPSSWAKVDLTSEHTLSALADDIQESFRTIKQGYNVHLESLHAYPAQAAKHAVRHITHLLISIAYERGAKINANAVAAACGVDWSPESADKLLQETFSAGIRDDVNTNWMYIQSVLSRASMYCRQKDTAPGDARSHQSSQHAPPPNPGPSGKSRQSTSTAQVRANTPGQVLATTEKTAYAATLTNVRKMVASVIGKMPPGFEVTPKCAHASAGNLTAFFAMSATDKSEEAQSQVREQYKAIMRAIHPDKHANEEAEILRAFMDMTKQYTVAFEAVTQWFGAPGN